MRTFSFFAPVKPVGVNRARQYATGFKKSPEMTAYQEAVALYGRNARIAAGGEPWTGPVSVTLRFFYLVDKPDNDGPQKPTQDCLAAKYGSARAPRVGAGIFLNDHQVQTTTSTKVIGDVEGVEVTVREVEVAAAENTLAGLKRLGAPKRNPTRRLTSSVKRYGGTR